jgi:hypothetical protein
MSLDTTNQALINAVHAIANKKLKAAANTATQAIIAQKNGKIAEMNKRIKELEAQLPEAGQAATAATIINPVIPVTNATRNAVERLITNTESGTAGVFTKWNNARTVYPNLPNNPKNIAQNQRTRLNAAIAKARASAQQTL